MKRNNESEPNHLVKEKSPYLLQHAFNPVAWFPWGGEAFTKARLENKPIFLSIGYSTCHWCHVMEKDSFVDQEVASLLNEYFISVKVDREERPDLDQKYMAVCQALTGQGGWPLTVILTPDLKPFYAGTFIPKDNRYGIIGLKDLLTKIKTLWKNDQAMVIQSGHELAVKLNQLAGENRGTQSATAQGLPSREILKKAYRHLQGNFDQDYAGFGQAPKFPSPHQLIFLLRYWKHTKEDHALKMVLKTLHAIHRGGIYDQLGYGIHRYSVDRMWLVPHFEKMLYDQATIAMAAAETFMVSDDRESGLMTEEVFSYVNRELTSPQGAFYSAEDADTAGSEGIFYVWRPEEIITILGSEKGQMVNNYFGVTEAGNFEGQTTVLSCKLEMAEFARANELSESAAYKIIDDAKQILLAERNKRERPFLDDKILTAWNCMYITALARGAVALQQPAYIKTAEKALTFIKAKLTNDRQLLRRYREDEAAIPAFLDDYAWLASAFIELFRATGNKQYLHDAEIWTEEMIAIFYVGNGILYFSKGSEIDGEEPLIAEAYDGATPSGVSVAAMNLLSLGRMLQNDRFYRLGEELIAGQTKLLKNHPTGFTYLLTALDYALSPGEDNPHCSLDGSCQ